MSPGLPRGFPWWVYWVLFVLIGLIGFAPLITTIVSVAIANAYGCQISETVLNACIINGVDWGRELQALGISAWFILLSWPLAFVLFVIWLIVLFFHRRAWRTRQGASA